MQKMKRLFFLSMFIVCLVSGFGQGNKFKAVNRTTADTMVNAFTKDAQIIDGSANTQLRSNGTTNPYLSTGQNRQLPSSIKKDSVPVITSKPVERKPVFIERERSQLRSAQMMSNKEITYAFFKETPSLYISRPEEQIRIDKIDIDQLGMSHVKGVQLFRNIPIYGMEFTFHISSQTELFMGYTLNPALIDASSALLSKEEAVRIAEGDLGQTAEVKPLSGPMKKLLNYDRPTTDSIYYPGKFNTYRISYKVIIRPNIRDEWIYYIDAQSGEIMEKFNNTPTAGPAKGTGLDLNNVQRTVDTYEEGGVYYLANTVKPMFNAPDFTGTITILDAKNNPNPGSYPYVTSNSTQWNNPKAISTMYNASLVYDYLRQTFDRNSFDGKGADMFCIINVPDDKGQPYDNAFWNGKFISLGNGNIDFTPTGGALDIIGHEFGHAVVQYTTNLEYKNQSGAINEGYADIFGAMVDRTNWTIGETIIKNKNNYPTGALRDMSNPHNGGKQLGDGSWQPAHVSEMYFGQQDNGGVHINCGISNYAYYLYATATSKEIAEQVYYRALCNYLTPTSKFVDLRVAVMHAAKDLYGDANAQLAANAFDRVGISDDSGSGKPTDLPANPGQQGLLLTNLDTRDRYGLYKTTDYASFTPLTTSKMYSKPSVTDDGKFVYFINASNMIRRLDLTTGQEAAVSSDAGYANVAISRDGNRLAYVTTKQDAKIYVYDFVSKKTAAFQLYNPTTGTDGAQSGGVKFAESFEFDHTGEYLLYDAYNVVGGSLNGELIDYWDIGMLHVWDKSANSFGTGQIDKLFAMLEPGMNVGNPTFSKNSPYIVAFDYMDKDQNFATFGMNLSTGDLNMMFTNSTTAFPNYSMDDKTIAFASYDTAPFVGYIALGADKISVSGQGTRIANYATFPIFYGTGTRQLGLKPAAAFSADVRSGGNPLTVQFVDLSENNPTSWSWTFQGGFPATSNQQHPKITYDVPGTYPVKLIVTNSYGNNEIEKKGYIAVEKNATGIEIIAPKTLTISPNPAADYIQVKGAGSAIQGVKLSDITGKTIPVSFSFDTEEIKVDVSGLHRGIYLLQVLLPEGKVLMEKFVKK